MGLFWRVLAGFGALTFLVGGLDLLGSDCDSVSFGRSGYRQTSYSCLPAGEGAISSGLAGTGMILIGLLMLLFAFWPLVGPYFVDTATVDRKSPPSESATQRSAVNSGLATSPGFMSAALANSSSVAYESLRHIAVQTRDDPRGDEVRQALVEFSERMQPNRAISNWFVSDSDHVLVIVYRNMVYSSSQSGRPTVDVDRPDVVVEETANGEVLALVVNARRHPNPRPGNNVRRFISQASVRGMVVVDDDASGRASPIGDSRSNVPEPFTDPQADDESSVHDGVAHSPDQPASQSGVGATAEDKADPTEVIYSTASWSQSQFTEITTQLAERGITFYMEEGDLVVTKRSEPVTDRVIGDVTGEAPESSA